jgi:hypothetical protein
VILSRAWSGYRLYEITLSFPSRSVFTSSCLVTASNNDESSDSGPKYYLNGGSLPTASSSESELILPSISSYWWQAPWYPLPAISFRLNTCFHKPYATSSLTRWWVCRLQLQLGLASAVILESEYRGTNDHILLSQIRDSSQHGGPGPRIYIRHELGGQVIPHALGSLSVSSYDLQGYRGGIPPRLHTGFPLLSPTAVLIARLHGSSRKHRFQNYLYCRIRIRCCGNVFTEPLPRNGSDIFAYLVVVAW